MMPEMMIIMMTDDELSGCVLWVLAGGQDALALDRYGVSSIEMSTTSQEILNFPLSSSATTVSLDCLPSHEKVLPHKRSRELLSCHNSSLHAFYQTDSHRYSRLQLSFCKQ